MTLARDWRRSARSSATLFEAVAARRHDSMSKERACFAIGSTRALAGDHFRSARGSVGRRARARDIATLTEHRDDLARRCSSSPGDGSKPTKKWLKRRDRARRDGSATAAFVDTRARAGSRWSRRGRSSATTATRFTPAMADANCDRAASNLVWACSTHQTRERETEQLAVIVGRSRGALLHEDPRGRRRCRPTAGNACIYVLSQLPGMRCGRAAVAARRAAALQPGDRARRQGASSSARAARRRCTRSISRSCALPTFGLDVTGRTRDARSVTVRGELAVVGRQRDARVCSTAASALKSIPAAVKSAHAGASRS